MVDHLLQEVDADVRAEKIQRLWTQYRSKLVLVIIALLVATAGNGAWKSYQEKRGGELMLALTEAQNLYNKGQFTEAAAAFETSATTARGDARTLAQLWQGRALVKAGKKPEAVKILTEASQMRSVWGDLACLRLAGLDVAVATCLADTHDSPLAVKRREWSAANDWSAGKKADAIATLEELATSEETTESSRSQISQWLASMRADETSGK